MGVNKPTIALAFVVAIVLTGCSFIDNKHFGVNHSGQAGLVEASVNTGLQKGVNDNAADTIENSVDSFDKQSQRAKNNQATEDNLKGSLEKHAIYFLYDSSEIEPGSMPVIEKQTQDVLENSGYVLILEGHADERGSREYNIGLGEERAKAVAKIMQTRGVRSNQLEIVSYGEEKPASLEHTETAWHLNRRVNLIPQRTQK